MRTLKEGDLVIWKADNSKNPYVMQIKTITEDRAIVVFYDYEKRYQTVNYPLSTLIHVDDYNKN